MSDPILIGDHVTFLDLPGGQLGYRREQHIPDGFLEQNRKEREDSLSTPAGEFHRVARIPEALVNEWGLEYVMNAPVSDILKRLQKAELDAFITSNKVS